MTPKVFLGLASLTVIAILAAAIAVVSQPAITTVNVNDAPAFPALNGRPEAASKVAIESRALTVNLSLKPDGTWGASDRGGYPVREQEVRDLVAKLADMRLVEAKTTRPGRFARLELEEVDAEDSKSRIVRVFDAQGTKLAEAIIGRNRGRTTGVERAGTYIRRPGESQTWLASGAVFIQTGIADWLQPTVLHIDAKNTWRVEVTPTNGGSYVAEKSTPEEAIKVVSELPEGKKIRDGSTSRLSAGLTNVDLDDVKPRAQFDLPEEHVTTDYKTFDGMEITVTLAKIDDKGWATFDAIYVGREGVSEEEAKAAQIKVDEINKRAANWAYQLQAHVYDRLSQTLEDYLTDENEPPPVINFPGQGMGAMPMPMPGAGQPVPEGFPPPEVMQQLQDALRGNAGAGQDAPAAGAGAAAPAGGEAAPAPAPAGDAAPAPAPAGDAPPPAPNP